MKPIVIKGAYQGNLKDISLTIPRNKMTVLTGLSGSGKSTLAVDVLYQECQRQYLEAMNYQGISKPKVEFIQNTSPAILITQKEYNRNPRSSLGTQTNMYTDLRMIYEKISLSECPICHKIIDPSECNETLVKTKDDFFVYINCPHCYQQIDKLTRSFFSYNTTQGACSSCHGLGKIMELDLTKLINEQLSLEEGAIALWVAKYKEYMIESLYHAFDYYGISYHPNTPVKDFNEVQRDILLNGIENNERYKDKPIPKTVQLGKFAGILPTLWKKYAEKSNTVQKYFKEEICPECQGERLQPRSRNALLFNMTLPQLSRLSLVSLKEWLKQLEETLTPVKKELVVSYLLDLQTKLNRLITIGLGYLCLDRQIKTLSGGEAQRLKLAATLDATIMGVIYILDEPTVGLHPKDTAGMIKVLKELRDLGNTLIIIEHDEDVMKEADYIIDLGPGAGKHGGEIVGQGTFSELMKQATSITGNYFSNKAIHPLKPCIKTKQHIQIKQASKHNLKNIDVNIPVNQMTLITGVSGSGKSSLVFEVLAKLPPNKDNHLDIFDEIIEIRQDTINRMKRSNIATYMGIYTEIRKLFAQTDEALNQAIKMDEFSFNVKGGRCENCEGLGSVVNNMLFFEDIEVTCPICHGQQFQPYILDIQYQQLNIKQVLGLSISEAKVFFQDKSSLCQKLQLLEKIGLGYLELGQTLTTLSGGEGQRLKMAKSLLQNSGKKSLYLLDEPTTGLHPMDIANFLVLLKELIDSGHTLVIIEHNLQMIEAADWVIDLGLEGGEKGGEIMVQGSVETLIESPHSYTGKYLKDYINK